MGNHRRRPSGDQGEEGSQADHTKGDCDDERSVEFFLKLILLTFCTRGASLLPASRPPPPSSRFFSFSYVPLLSSRTFCGGRYLTRHTFECLGRCNGGARG